MKQCILLLCFLLSCCKQDSQPQRTGLSFTEVETTIAPTVCGSEEPTAIIEVNGTGLGLFDFDNDSDLDLFVVSTADDGCRLYENRSEDDIVFTDVTEELGIQVRGWMTGVAIADVDGDGFEDLYVTSHGNNVLLKNNAGVSFTDESHRISAMEERWSTSARFGDLDGDGDVDLYVCNYLMFDFANPPPKALYKGEVVLGGPHGLPAQRDVVFENNGNGAFEDVTEEWGFAREPAFSLNASILDFNGDGFQDVFVGNDSMANDLFLHDGSSPPSFTNVGLHSGVATNGDGSMQATMGIAIADVSGNSLPDIFTTNFSSDTNTLHTNNETGYFDDRTSRYGLGIASRTLLGWTCGFHDFDADGDEDLFIVNGHVYPNATLETMDSTRAQPILLYERVGGRFVSVPQSEPFRDRSAVFGDIDGDSDVDVIVAQRDGEIRVLRNNANPAHTRLLSLEGNALGSKITLHYDDESTETRWYTDGFGFQSSSATGMLLSSPKPVRTIEIVWPDGFEQQVTSIPENGPLVFRQQTQ